ncbi:radical SAM protein [Lysinibacillus sp. KCTC 33748]|uniref:SPL family radical SAM protein n=1 Tax=unclassified Lysinibacillus TaxID=2636778 RepID=UPI0009A90009|nr:MULTISPECIES: radical SAM protein [unclassified Lysinibacillus]OXS73578.1 radical SAM protein [Lysinibacillus sp. KCTC 33748]SKB80569.1 DNA repair photolyase [Lysinibacillus sp. AC-3]
MKSELFYKNPKTILNKGTGFLSGYTHSLNPYTGCSFGCSYCYVREMPVSLFREGEWGNWVDVKNGAANLLKKELRRAKAKGNVSIFMSSSTDPYQPIEHKEKVTRSLLEVMVEDPPDFLLVQTRSPLVSRDIDLLQHFKDRVRVSMTIETDSETIRKHFTPKAPPIPARFKTLEQLAAAEIPTQVAIAPILPSGEYFPMKLKPFVDRICIDDYFMGDGSGGKRTRKLGLEKKYAQLGLEEWYGPHVIKKAYNRFIEIFPENNVYVSQAGFEP